MKCWLLLIQHDFLGSHSLYNNISGSILHPTWKPIKIKTSVRAALNELLRLIKLEEMSGGRRRIDRIKIIVEFKD